MVDDIVARLVALLGDAGRKGLINLVLGTDLERALARAAAAAVTETANQLRQGGGEPAQELARVIGQVFTARGPRELDVVAEGTLLEAIVSGVSAQVAVLGEPELTGQGVSAADVLGIPAGVIAERLTFHLIARIKAVALDSGPLLPLASQLNHDEASMRDQWSAGVLVRVDQGVRAILDQLDGPSVTATAAEFAGDVRAFLRGLAEQAAHGRLPSYLGRHADVLGLTREVRVRAGIRRGGGGPVADGRAYALAADRDQRECPPQPWPKFAAEHNRVVMLADPGLGKSWLIRTETHRLATAALAQADGDLAGLIIPIPLRCDQLAAAEGPDLPTRAASHLAAQGLLAERSRGPMTGLIRAGRAVLLLDALDELTNEEAGVVRSLISSWADQARTRAQCVITSRIAGYTGPPLPGAAEVELQPFTTEDVKQVIGAWGLPPAAERELLGRAGDPAVAAMARVPLLLAMLCALAAAQPAGRELPATRGELYERMLRWFLTGAHRGADDPATTPLTDLEVEGLLQLLAPVAYTFAARPGGWTDLMPSGDLLRAIRESGPAFTDLGRPATQVLLDLSAGAGILVPDRDPTDGRSPRYLFLHRTFTEYLTARHLATLPAPDWLAIVTQHQWFDPDWQAVVPMLGGLLDSTGASQLITHLLASDPDPFWHALLTAIAVAGERPDPDAVLSDAQSARLAQAISTLLGHDFGRGLIRDHVAGLTHMPRAVQKALLARLDDPDKDLRRLVTGALDGLARPTDHDVTVGLLVRLNDSDRDVRQAATRALARRGGQDVTTGLLASLDDPSWPVRLAATLALARRDGHHVTNALLAHLGDSEENVREAAASALAGREDPELTAALLARLDDRSLFVPAGAVKALAERKGQDVTAALLAHFDASRYEVAKALAKRHGQDVTAALIAHLDDEVSWAVSIQAAEGLATRDGQDVTAALIAHLDGRHYYLVRKAAAEALTGREGRDVTRSLLACLDDPEWSVRQAAARALAGREGRDVTAGLLAHLNDPNWEGEGAAFEVLAEREDQDVTTGLLARLDDPDWQVRCLAAGLLAGREGQKVTTGLLTLLDDEDVRETAAESLAGREGPDITAALLALLDDPNSDIRKAVARALAGRAGQDVTAALLALLDDSDENVREAAAECLAGREGQDVTAALLTLLDDTGYIRELAPRFLAGREGQDVTAALLAHLCGAIVDWEAALALAGREGQDVTSALLACLDRRGSSDRWVASEALARRGSPLDLITLTQGIRSVPASSDALKAAYQLTRRHYQALSGGDQEMIRTTMSKLTSALPPNH